MDINHAGADGRQIDPQPRWQAVVAVLAVGVLYFVLPGELTLGPKWLFPALIIALLIPTVISHRTGRHSLNATLGLVVSILLTIILVLSLIRLISALDVLGDQPKLLLRSAALLWITNILVFALWYWRLDAGGPHERDKRLGHPDGAFLFPQMTMREADLRTMRQQHWSPNFVEYLFLAFNVSTALSPSDVPVLARWAKVLMMLQSILSLLIVALLAAHAVGSL